MAQVLLLLYVASLSYNHLSTTTMPYLSEQRQPYSQQNKRKRQPQQPYTHTRPQPRQSQNDMLPTQSMSSEQAAQFVSQKHIARTKALTNIERFGRSTPTMNADSFLAPADERQTLATFIAPFMSALSESQARKYRNKRTAQPTKHSARSSQAKVDVLILCSSALRACDIYRHLFRSKNSYPFVRLLKLFPKHMKLSEQVSFLQELDVRDLKIGVGTPHRLLQLYSPTGNNGGEKGSDDSAAAKPVLSPNDTSLLVFDLKTDKKKYSVLDLPMVSDDLFKLLRLFHTRDASGAEPQAKKEGIQYLLW